MSSIGAREILKKKQPTILEHVYPEDFAKSPNLMMMARYLYWACFRGQNHIIKLIFEKFKVSPFVCIYEGRSPLMASLIGKHDESIDIYWDSLDKHFQGFLSNRAQLEIC